MKMKWLDGSCSLRASGCLFFSNALTLCLKKGLLPSSRLYLQMSLDPIVKASGKQRRFQWHSFGRVLNEQQLLPCPGPSVSSYDSIKQYDITRATHLRFEIHFAALQATQQLKCSVTCDVCTAPAAVAAGQAPFLSKKIRKLPTVCKVPGMSASGVCLLQSPSWVYITVASWR